MSGWRYSGRDRWVPGSAQPIPGCDDLASLFSERVRIERRREFGFLQPGGLARCGRMPEVLLRGRPSPHLWPEGFAHVPSRLDGSTCRRPSPGRRSSGIGRSGAWWKEDRRPSLRRPWPGSSRSPERSRWRRPVREQRDASFPDGLRKGRSSPAGPRAPRRSAA